MLRTLARTALLCLAATLATAARAESPVSARHAAWQSCLHEAFALQASLTGRGLAADGALRDCREAESAYLSALAASPLVDAEDVARVRPALVARARFRLLGTGSSRAL